MEALRVCWNNGLLYTTEKFVYHNLNRNTELKLCPSLKVNISSLVPQLKNGLRAVLRRYTYHKIHICFKGPDNAVCSLFVAREAATYFKVILLDFRVEWFEDSSVLEDFIATYTFYRVFELNVSQSWSHLYSKRDTIKSVLSLLREQQGANVSCTFNCIDSRPFKVRVSSDLLFSATYFPEHVKVLKMFRGLSNAAWSCGMQYWHIKYLPLYGAASTLTKVDLSWIIHNIDDIKSLSLLCCKPKSWSRIQLTTRFIQNITSTSLKQDLFNILYYSTRMNDFKLRNLAAVMEPKMWMSILAITRQKYRTSDFRVLGIPLSEQHLACLHFAVTIGKVL